MHHVAARRHHRSLRPDRRRAVGVPDAPAGDEVVHLVRRPPAPPRRSRWDPASRSARPRRTLAGVDAVVHLAGAGVGDQRWTPGYKQQIFASRVDGTHTLASALAERRTTPSGPGEPVRGRLLRRDRGDEVLTEDSEQRARVPRRGRARLGGAQPSRPRTAGPAGRAPPHRHRAGPRGSGAMARLLPLARLGLAGPLGSGQQYWPLDHAPATRSAPAYLRRPPRRSSGRSTSPARRRRRRSR